MFIKAIRAKSYHGNIAPHYFFKSEHKAIDSSRLALGTQVLLDILLLAKCDHFLHAESSVASLASYFNPHMKSYFMEPGKQAKHKVCKQIYRRIGTINLKIHLIPTVLALKSIKVAVEVEVPLISDVC